MTQPDAREGQAGPPGVSERPIVPSKPGNAGGGKGPWFKVNVQVAQSREIGDAPNTSLKVQKLREAVHAKAKRAPTYRFYRGALGGRAGGSAAYRIVDRHVCFRLRQWLGRRQRVQGSSRSRFSEPYLRRSYGLIQLEGRPRQVSWANA